MHVPFVHVNAMQTRKLLLLMCGALLVSMTLFMTVKSGGHWDFVLGFRGGKLVALLVVAYAISISTVLFQTITSNRILTPYIMGFDALYLLIQTVLIFTFGGIGYVALGHVYKFGFEIGIMLFASLVMFSTLFLKAQDDLYRMVLTGVILGVLFRSLTTFLQRVIDPEEFAVVQSVSFAQFNVIRMDLLSVSLVIVAIVSLIIWRYRYELDVIALGRDHAINLGVNYKFSMVLILFLISVLVSISTALVGPVSFFGLLVSGIVYPLMKTHRHAVLIPAAFLIGSLILVTGQLIFEHFLGMQSVLSVVVEFLGGIVFIIFLLRRKAL
ncbi:MULTISPECIES: iron chelate uptake ABC transporter family permease subunit [Oligella]|uniref:iron chelate uptake ABC transporter family permease subunit n=1 Tax=Oligella TaxID=90243 RepID=UPI00311A5719